MTTWCDYESVIILFSPNASCQFLLQPQDLNRPVSEYCYQTCPNKSETVVMSVEALASKKSAVKSRSMTSICSENVTRNQIDVMTVREGPKIREAKKYLAPCDQKCKVNKKNQELPQQLPSQSKLRNLCEKNCPTKEECLIYEDMLQQSLAQSQIMYDQSKQYPVAQEAQLQMRNAPGDQINNNMEMRELPGYSIEKKTCDKNCGENQRSSFVQNHNNREECKITIDTDVNTSACQLINTPCNQNIVVKPPCASTMMPAKSENVERIYDQTCRYNNFVEEIKGPETRASLFPCQPCRQLNKNQAKAKKVPSKGESTDHECQCPEENPFVEQSYARQFPVGPRSNDFPPCKCFITEQMPLSVQVPQVPYKPNEFCRPGNEIKLKTEQIASTCQRTSATLDQNITTQQCVCMMPEKTENVGLRWGQSCPVKYTNINVEEIKAPQTRTSVFPSQPSGQFHKKGAKVTKVPSKRKSTDHECQCPEEKPFLKQSYPCQVPVEPRSNDFPPCKCFMTQQMPLPVQMPQVPYKQKEFCRPENEIKLKTKTQISSTCLLKSTAFNRNISTQQKSAECMMPEESESVGLRWGQTCPVKYTNNDVEEIRTSMQTRGTMFPCELSSETQVTQQQTQYNTRANMKNVSSKRLNMNIECHCPKEKHVIPPYQCIELERIPPAPMQAKPIQSAIQPYPQNESTSGYSEKVFAKISQKSTDNVCCGCSEENDLQCGTCCPKSTCLQAKTKTVNVPQYPIKINPIKVNVSCQCSENDIEQVETHSFISYIHKEEKKIMVDVSCQCSEENVLQYVTPCPFRRNDFENCDATCVHRKLVRSAGPACTVPGTDSFVIKNSLQVKKLSRSSPILRSDSVQTSDHSISLEKEDYALFLKIICADKLNDSFCG